MFHAEWAGTLDNQCDNTKAASVGMMTRMWVFLAPTESKQPELAKRFDAKATGPVEGVSKLTRMVGMAPQDVADNTLVLNAS